MRDQVFPVEEGWACIIGGKLCGPYNSRLAAERMLMAHKTRIDMQRDLDPLIREDRPE